MCVEDVQAAMRPETVLVTVMHSNNEVSMSSMARQRSSPGHQMCMQGYEHSDRRALVAWEERVHIKRGITHSVRLPI